MRKASTVVTLLILAVCPWWAATAQTAATPAAQTKPEDAKKAPPKDVKKKAPSPQPPAPAPLMIMPVYDGALTVTGYAPIAKVQLTVAVNGVAGKVTVPSDDRGGFTIPLPAPAKAGNFIEITGKAGNVQVRGSTTVLASGAPSPPGPKTLPVTIQPVHDSESLVTGYTPVPKILLSLKINGTAVKNSLAADASGGFSFSLSTPVKTGNFIEITGSSGDTQVYGSTTVVAKADTPAQVKLSKPTIKAAVNGDPSVAVTRNTADATQVGLSLYISLLRAGDPNRSEGIACQPDDSTGQCTWKPGSPLKEGDAIQAFESVPAADQAPPIQGPIALAIVGPAPAVGKPTIGTLNEGDRTVTVTAAKDDLTRTGLRVLVRILPRSVGTRDMFCIPDSTSGQCTVSFASGLLPDEVVEAEERADYVTGAKVEARVVPGPALGKPIIVSPQEGDESITVSVNSNDKQAGIQIGIDVCNPDVKLSTCLAPDQNAKAEHHSCAPDDATGTCTVALLGPLMLGQTIRARETIADRTQKLTDAEAVATVTVKPSLGLPIAASVKETDTSLKLTVNPDDYQKWNGSVTFHVTVYTGSTAVTQKTCTPTPGQDNCTVSFDSQLVAGEVIHAYESATPPAAGSGASAATPPKPGAEILITVSQLGFDWGRVRAYFSLGAVFSRYTTSTPTSTPPATTSATNFSSPDVYAGMDMDFNWYSTQKCLAYPFGSQQVKLPTLVAAAVECIAKKRKTKGSSATSTGPIAPPTGTSAAGAPETAKAPSTVAKPPTGTSAAGAPETAKAPCTVAKPEGSPNELLARSMSFVSDRSMLKVLDFLSGLNFSDAKIKKVKRLVEIVSDIGCRTQELEKAMKQQTDDPSSTLLERREFQREIARLEALELTPHEAQQILEQFSYESKAERGWMLNSYVLTRLTQTSASNSFTLVNSPNSLHLEGGIYAPIYAGWSRWRFKNDSYALFAAPLVKLGFDSLRGSATDPLFQTAAGTGTPNDQQQRYINAVAALNRDVYRMMAFGGRLGLFALSPTPRRAPELISFIDFTYGRYDNFFVPTFGDNPNGSVRFPWRFGMNARLNIPSTIFYVGVDLNKGTGPDSMSIFVGARADLSAMLGKLIPSAQH